MLAFHIYHKDSMFETGLAEFYRDNNGVWTYLFDKVKCPEFNRRAPQYSSATSSFMFLQIKIKRGWGRGTVYCITPSWLKWCPKTTFSVCDNHHRLKGLMKDRNVAGPTLPLTTIMTGYSFLTDFMMKWRLEGSQSWPTKHILQSLYEKLEINYLIIFRTIYM